MNVFVIIDGLGDLPVPELSNKLPLEVAHVPNLNWFASHGKNGHVYSIREGIAPESDGAVIALLGNDVEKVYTGRGPLEAYGAGLRVSDGDLVFRTNFATVEGTRVVDRRAGRGLTTPEAKLLEKSINTLKMSVPFTYKSTVQHRGVVVFRGAFSDSVSNVDPAYVRVGKIGVAQSGGSMELNRCEAVERSSVARRSAAVVNEFVDKVIALLAKHPLNTRRKKNGLLSANALLVRDAGVRLPNLAQRKGWEAVVSMPLEIGVARRCGMNVRTFAYPEMRVLNVYNNLYAGLRKAIHKSKTAIKKGNASHYYIHFKEIDVCGHDGNYKEKIKMLELVDKEFFGFLRNMKNIKLVVTGDHSTPCVKKGHSDDPVPLLWYGAGADGVSAFNERSCMYGSLGKMYGKNVLRVCGFL